MFPGPSEPNKEQAETPPEELDPSANEAASSYPPSDSSYPPQTYQPSEPPQNPYASPQPNPYQPPANPYSTPLGGAPNAQQQPNPYPQPSPYDQNPNPYAQQPNQYNNSPYPPPANQPWTGQQNYGGMPYGGFAVPVDANRILIYGIVSFFCFGIIFGPMAFIQGTQAINAIDAGQADPTDRGKVQAGRICGLIGGILSVIVIVIRIVMLASMFSGHSSP